MTRCSDDEQREGSARELQTLHLERPRSHARPQVLRPMPLGPVHCIVRLASIYRISSGEVKENVGRKSSVQKILASSARGRMAGRLSNGMGSVLVEEEADLSHGATASVRDAFRWLLICRRCLMRGERFLRYSAHARSLSRRQDAR